MKYATFETFQVMFGRKSTLPELIDLLRPFSRKSVLHTCATVGVLLRLWERNPHLKHYDHLVSVFFSGILGDCYKWSSRQNPPAYVFHRRQLLFLMKLAILNCPEKGQEVASTRPGPFGLILLMANDHFYYGLYREDRVHSIRDNLARLVAEFVPISEAAGFEITNWLTRSHLMLTKHVKMSEGNQDFIDISAEYERLTGLSLIQHEAICFFLFAKWSTLEFENLRVSPGLMWLHPQQFRNTALTQEKIDGLLRQLTAETEQLIIESSDLNLVANDFTVFRNTPLLRDRPMTVPADVLFLVEKFQSGPYWRVNDLSREIGDKLRRFWGVVFESYCNDLLARSFAGSTCSILIPDPRDPDDPNVQICDAIIIEGDSLVLLEYKSNMFSAKSKYSGDYVALQKEIESKYVRTDKRQKKGVEQLSAAVLALTTKGDRFKEVGLDISCIRRIYPVLITLDEIGGSLLMSALLNTYFFEILPETRTSEITPLFCFDIESLELFAGSLGDEPISAFLSHWFSHDPSLRGTLLGFLKQTARRSSYLSSEWERLYEAMGKILFPGEFSKVNDAHLPTQP
jgi:hypothetical protein